VIKHSKAKREAICRTLINPVDRPKIRHRELLALATRETNKFESSCATFEAGNLRI
jgi:hypothetical protein